MSNFYALIMAGGSGTRLWPLSRQHKPKQALRLVGDRTMFQHAVDRLEGLLPIENVLVVTARDYVPILSSQVPGIPLENFVVEPKPRGTAAAIGLGSIHLNRRDPQAIMAVLTADHYITNVEGFRRALAVAARAAAENHIVTLGIQPDFPATGFGYVRRRDQITSIDGLNVYEVEAFVEKPDLELATEFLNSDLYSWNSGMFIWQTSRIMAEFAHQMPELYHKLQTLEAILGTDQYQTNLEQIWPTVHKDTIDYGVMENAEDVVVVPVDIGWTDIGDWEAVFSMAGLDEDSNLVVDAQHLSIDTTGSLIRGNQKLIATIGLHDVVVINTDDALLICRRDQAQQVKTIVSQLQTQGQTEYL